MREITEEDIKFDKLLSQYRERFDDSYGINFGDTRPLSYHIGIMEEALRTGIPAKIDELDLDPDIIV